MQAKLRLGGSMIDSLTHYGAELTLEADICVVGAGPVGLALASELANGPIKVLLLESGGQEPEESAQALNRGKAIGMPFQGLEAGRVRAFGGTTWTWSGQCLSLDPEVLRPRSWLPGSGWPIDDSELNRYTDRAASFLGVPSTVFEEDAWTRRGISPPRFDEEIVRVGSAGFARPVNIGRRHLALFRRSETVTAMLHATVTGLELASSGTRIEGARLATFAGARGTVHAKAFVLCGGGIENARLLLLSDRLRDRLPALGRNLQDHPIAACAEIEPFDRRALQDQFALLRAGRHRRLPRLALAAERQRRDGVLASHANVGWSPPIAVEAIRELRRRPHTVKAVMRPAVQLAAGFPELVSALARRTRGLSTAPRSGRIWLEVNSEQPPNPDSRVALGQELDRFGVPEPVVHWRVGELERRTMVSMVEAVGDEFLRLGLAQVRPAPWLNEPGLFSKNVSDASHHIGTTRMAALPVDGVVDPNCQVHGVDNLFIAGTSTFPWSGAANPTLTAVALAIRLAEHLKKQVH